METKGERMGNLSSEKDKVHLLVHASYLGTLIALSALKLGLLL